MDPPPYRQFARWCDETFGASPRGVSVVDGVVYTEGGPTAAQLASHADAVGTAKGAMFPLASWRARPARGDVAAAAVAVIAIVCVAIWGLPALPAAATAAWIPHTTRAALTLARRAWPRARATRTKKTA